MEWLEEGCRDAHVDRHEDCPWMFHGPVRVGVARLRRGRDGLGPGRVDIAGAGNPAAVPELRQRGTDHGLGHALRPERSGLLQALRDSVSGAPRRGLRALVPTIRGANRGPGHASQRLRASGQPDSIRTRCTIRRTCGQRSITPSASTTRAPRLRRLRGCSTTRASGPYRATGPPSTPSPVSTATPRSPRSSRRCNACRSRLSTPAKPTTARSSASTP